MMTTTTIVCWQVCSMFKKQQRTHRNEYYLLWSLLTEPGHYRLSSLSTQSCEWTSTQLNCYLTKTLMIKLVLFTCFLPGNVCTTFSSLVFPHFILLLLAVSVPIDMICTTSCCCSFAISSSCVFPLIEDVVIRFAAIEQILALQFSQTHHHH